jgi:hypothetical protein
MLQLTYICEGYIDNLKGFAKAIASIYPQTAAQPA